MRISPSGPQGVPEPYRNGAAAPAAGRPSEGVPGEGAAEADTVTLSPQAQLIQRLQRELGITAGRAARVADLKLAVDSGRYRVPADQIARRMLERGFSRT